MPARKQTRKVKKATDIGLEAYRSTLILVLIVSPLLLVAYMITIATANIESEVVKNLVNIFGDLALVGIGYFIRGQVDNKDEKKKDV